MTLLSNYSIKSKLIIFVLTLLIFALAAFSAFTLFLFYQHSTSVLHKQSTLQSHLISDYAVTPLLFSDKIAAQEVLSKLESIPNINRAVLHDESGNTFAVYEKQEIIDTSTSQEKMIKKPALFFEDEMIISSPVVYDQQTYGEITLYVSTKNIAEEILYYLGILSLSIIALIVFSLLVINRLQHYITFPIINLAEITKEISQSGNYNIRARKMHRDEVGNLYDDFNSMLDKIEQRGLERDMAEDASELHQRHLEDLTNELEDRVNKRTLELQESLEKLQSAQSQLIESEKMSALGNLVAGVAHEVNTPLGISITAASIFKNEIKSLQNLLEKNELSKSGLEHFIETVAEADDILIKNLDRAALLVKNFKKISIDQSSEEIRDFELNVYLKEVVSTFKNELKHRPVTLELDLDEKDIKMHSFPGAIAQIIVNLLQNTLLHAFDFDQKGVITIKTEFKDEYVLISFSDDGKGVDKTVEAKIFEPFITTKRNSGGTGLGLNITYNLVTQYLKGTIGLCMDNTKGACFLIKIPCIVTEADVNSAAEDSLLSSQL